MMISSLTQYLRDGDEVVVLAMDDAVARTLPRLALKHVRIVNVEMLGDAELMALRYERAPREFCWTCTPAFASWMVGNSQEGDLVVYLDADLFFFRDPRLLFEELDDGGNILVHEHRYSPDRAHFEPTSGRFNVGLVAFRVGPEARACAQRWRAQTVEKCVLDPDNGYCGDQGYLNEWPAIYPGLRILRNIGGGVAPWNVNQYRIAGSDGQPIVDDEPVVFFHYHALEILTSPGLGVTAITPSRGYSFPRETLKAFYRPYAKAMRRIAITMSENGYAVKGERTCSFIDLVKGLAVGRYVIAI
jgi:hypothetical protein